MSKDTIDVLTETKRIIVVAMLSPIVAIYQELSKLEQELGWSKTDRLISNPHFLLTFLTLLASYRPMCERMGIDYKKFLEAVNTVLEPYNISTDRLEEKFGKDLKASPSKLRVKTYRSNK